MIVPTIATVVVGTSGLVDHMETPTTPTEPATWRTCRATPVTWSHSLQDERAAAVLLLGRGRRRSRRRSTRRPTTGSTPGGPGKRPATGSSGPSSTDLPDNLRELCSTASTRTCRTCRASAARSSNGKLDAHRDRAGVRGSDQRPARPSATRPPSSPVTTTLSDRMRAAAAVAREKEYLAARRVVVHRALGVTGGKRLTPALRRDYIASDTGQQQALQSFKAVATAGQTRALRPDGRRAATCAAGRRTTPAGSTATPPATCAGAPFGAGPVGQPR